MGVSADRLYQVTCEAMQAVPVGSVWQQQHHEGASRRLVEAIAASEDNNCLVVVSRILYDGKPEGPPITTNLHRWLGQKLVDGRMTQEFTLVEG